MPRSARALAAEVRRRLKALADPEFSEGARKYFKHEVKILGVRSPDVQAVGREVRSEFKAAKDLEGALALCEALLETGVLEEGSVAVTILQGFLRQLGPDHYPLFDRWLDHCTNWAIIDGLCGKALGPVIREHGPPISRLLKWARSRNRWRRRAAAVSLIPSVRRGLHHDAAFEIADHLMPDEDDMVRKGVGWLLKVTADADRRRVIDYLLKWKDRTSRLVLRYAAEKMTPAQRKRVLA